MTEDARDARVRGVLVKVDGLERIIDRIGQLEGLRPRASSLAARELGSVGDSSSGWRADPIEMTHMIGGMFMASAHAGLEPLRRLLEPPSMAWAPYVVGRSVLEASARAWWIFDPDIDAPRRVARALTEHLDSLEEQRLAHAAIGDEEASEKIRQTIARVAQAARIDGFEVGDRRGRFFIGAPRERHTTLVAKLLDPGFPGEAVYRHYAGMTHSALGALYDGLAEAPDPDDPTRLRATPKITTFDIAHLVAATAFAVARAFDHRVAYFGWGDDEWRSWRQHMLTELHAAWERERALQSTETETAETS